jgi:hypothetical protein
MVAMVVRFDIALLVYPSWRRGEIMGVRQGKGRSRFPSGNDKQGGKGEVWDVSSLVAR